MLQSMHAKVSMKWHQASYPEGSKDQFMVKLHEELSKCLVKASLQSAMATAWSLSNVRRHLWAHFSSHARPSSAEGRRELPSDQVTPCQEAHGLIAETVEVECSNRVHCQIAHKPPSWASRRPHRHTSPFPSPLHPLCKDEQ